MHFQNPLAHVEMDDGPATVTLGGREVPFSRLGLDQISALASRHAVIRAQLDGAAVDPSTLTADDQLAMAVDVIAMAIAPGAPAGDEFDAMCASIRALRPLEREIAFAVILQSSLPKVVALPFQVSPAKANRAARRASTKAPAKGRRATRAAR